MFLTVLLEKTQSWLLVAIAYTNPHQPLLAEVMTSLITVRSSSSLSIYWLHQGKTKISLGNASVILGERKENRIISSWDGN